MEFLLGFNDRGFAGAYLFDVGVPHLVLINFEVWNEQDRAANGSMLRAHESLGSEGANVTWLSRKTFETVTFERGVEKETLACGSGAMAAFLAMEVMEKEQGDTPAKKYSLRFPGGTLTVFREASKLWLSGPVRVVFKGELNER